MRGVKIAAVLAALGLLVILALAPLGESSDSNAESTARTTIATMVTAMPASQLPPISTTETPMTPFVMPTEIAQVETQDGDYLQRLLRAGMNWDTREGIIDGGHKVCTDLVRGITPEMMARYIYTVAPPTKNLTLGYAREFVHIPGS